MTSGEIEKLLRTKVSVMKPPITGKVYYDGTRPMQNDIESSNKEDIIVKVVAGTFGQIVNGSCVVNVYVPDIVTSSGARMCDRKECDKIAKWLEKVPKTLNKDNDVRFEQTDMIMTLSDAPIRQHFVSLKMDFKVLID